MAFNGAGVWSRLYTWVTDKANSIAVTASRMDAELDDMANNGLTKCLLKDGQQNPTANLPMATYRHTGVGNAAARTDYTAAGQTQDGSLIYGTVGGTANAITIDLTPSVTAYVPGQAFRFIASANNSGAVTVNIDGVGAQALVGGDGTALVADEIKSGQVVEIFCKTTTQFQLANKFPLGPAAVQSGTYVWGGTSGGTASAQTITLSPAPAAYAAGQGFRFKIGNTNTGSTTLNVNSLGAKNILNMNGTALVAGQLVANGVADVTYDGTSFYLNNVVRQGSLILLDAVNASSGNPVTFTLSGYVTCSVYEIELINIIGSSSSMDLQMLMNGASSGYSYVGNSIDTAATAATWSSSSAASIALTDPALTVSDTQYGAVGRVIVSKDAFGTAFFELFVQPTAGARYRCHGVGLHGTAASLTSIGFQPSAGSFASGTIRLYGRI